VREPRPISTSLLIAVTALAAAPLAFLAYVAVTPRQLPPLVAAALALTVLILVTPALFVAISAERRKRWLDRRAKLHSTAVNVAHAIGSTLDPLTVFREVYAQVAGVMPVDAFYVAIADAGHKHLSYRFLVEGGKEMEPVELDFAGTLAGRCIDKGSSILLRDAEHDREKLGIPRVAWGTVEEHSIIVAPLRMRNAVIGAISAQSVQMNAYDESDVELIGNIAAEAGIAVERAELHERTHSLSRRLVDLHRLGTELANEPDMDALCLRLATSSKEIIGADHGSVYLDTGGDVLVLSGSQAQDVRPVAIEKRGTLTEQALRTRQPVFVQGRSEVPEVSRRHWSEGKTGSVLVQPLLSGDESVGVLYVAWNGHHTFSTEERELVGVIAGIGATALRSARLYGELEEAYLSTVTALTATIQAREGYREDHLRNVAADAVALGQRLRLPEEGLRALRYAALFHSIGKIAVPAAILGKAGSLSAEERRLVQEHPVLGAQIIGSIRFLEDVAPIVRNAAERWDGTGYPDGLKGEDIPQVARILAIAIAFQAMRVDRPYRPALSVTSALSELRANAGACYDPTLVEEFASMILARGAIEEAEQEIGGARELAILSELTPQFHSLLDLDQLLMRVLTTLEKRMPGARLGIFLEDETSGDLVLRASTGSWAAKAQRRLARGRGVASWVMEHAQAQVIDDVLRDPRWVQTEDDTRSALEVPLMAGGRPLGVLALLHSSEAAFSQRDVTLIQAVGTQLAGAVQVAGLHERIKVAASTDALTGIHNYRYFWDRLQEEISRTERRGGELSMAYFDIDLLKKVNDEFGHLAGDAVLRTLGRVIGANVRGEDVPARYGGDEFAIVMPDTPREEAEQVVERLMELLDRTPVDIGDGRTIAMPSRSWGISTYPADGRTARELVGKADSLAYAHKRGR
jgi:diguanylate cyclase (GGDEF)-like protein